MEMSQKARWHHQMVIVEQSSAMWVSRHSVSWDCSVVLPVTSLLLPGDFVQMPDTGNWLHLRRHSMQEVKMLQRLGHP